MINLRILMLVTVVLLLLLLFKDTLMSAESCVMTTGSVQKDPEQQPRIFIFDLPMNSPVLIQEIRSQMVQPAERSVPYKLSGPKRKFFSQFKQDELVNTIFGGKRDGVFLEAGALDGEMFSNTLFLERELGWTGLLVEPGPRSFSTLISRKRKSVAINACLSPTDTSAELAFDISVPAALAKIVDNPQRAKKKKTVTVPCFPFFSILQAYGNPIIDYMSLDIEGHEMKVLRTVPWKEVNIRLVAIEINHVPEGRDAVKRYMEEQGYVFYKLQKIDYFFYRPDLAEGMNFP